MRVVLDRRSEELGDAARGSLDDVSRTPPSIGTASATAEPSLGVAARGSDRDGAAVAHDSRASTSAHVPGTAGRTGANTGAFKSAGSTFGGHISCPHDRDIRIYDKVAKALVLAPEEHRMAASLCCTQRGLRNETGASVAVPTKEKPWEKSVKAASAAENPVVTHERYVNAAVWASASPTDAHKQAFQRQRDTDATIVGAVRAFSEKFGHDEVGAMAAVGSGSIFDDTPAIDTDVDGKRKQSMADLDVVASKTGNHGDGASAATACSRPGSRGQISADRSVSAGHLQQRWRSAVAHQRAIAAEAGDNVAKGASSLADSERLESGCRDSSGSKGRRANDAEAGAAEHGRLWGEAQAQFDDPVGAQPCNNSDEIMRATEEVVQETFRRAADYLADEDPREMADIVDSFGSDREEASDCGQSNVEVSASMPTPVCLPELTGWNRYSPGQFFRVALREKAIIAKAEEQRKKDAEKAEKAKGAAAEKKTAKAVTAAKAVAEERAGGMAVGRGHSGPSEGTRGVKRQAEGDQSDGGAGVIRRSTREARPTPANKLGQQQKRERLHSKQRA